METGEFLLVLIAIFGSAKLFGELATRIGQPAVLGELVAGLVVGVSGLGIVNPSDHTIHLLAELGVVLLLFLIGLETDLKSLLSVGFASTSVAIVGVVLPFVGGYIAARQLGLGSTTAIFLGASLTATSVGITARVLSDLGHLEARESQVILGAAVLDDVIGLVILSIVSGFAAQKNVSAAAIAKTAGLAFGFVGAALVVGTILAPALLKLIRRLRVDKALFFASVMFAFTLAYLAEVAGSALIVGSFAAGLVLARTRQGEQIGREVHDIAQFFIPIFFVVVGAAVDLRSVNPFDPAARPAFIVGVVLTIVAILSKAIAGFFAVGGDLRRSVIGVGMIPRGEVGLIFAQIGLAAALIDRALYGSVAMMVMLTTLVTPPTLRLLLKRRIVYPPRPDSELASLVMRAPDDGADD